jgi:polysaccharide biosynthesis/export protein
MTMFPSPFPGKALLAATALIALAGCSSLGAAGPSTGQVREAGSGDVASADIRVIDLDGQATARLAALSSARSFAEVFGDSQPIGTLIRRGDVIDVNIWEAPPAVLFGAAASAAGVADNAMLASSTTIPQQRVGEDGTIAVPFVGTLAVDGKTTAQVQREIVARLRGRAHDPQAVVRLVENDASTVTIMGAVAMTRRVPLTGRGERLLDALAEAGGPREGTDKTTIRLTRGARAESMPLERILLDPAQNITLQTNDVVTVIHQPYSFVALGAVLRNAEIPFEGSGLTLAQALGRVGGLRDDRADIRGVFLFRLEDPAALDPALLAAARTTQDGRVPVIYRLDLSDASSFFVAQDFAMRDDDMLYISSAPGADLQRFIATISNVALSTIAIGNSL